MSFVVQMVDVFGAEPLSGNPLAVVIGADALGTEELQRLTRWFNLSETAFLLSPSHPGADYRVRIFTLEREMPFAGHPTLGSCHAWLSAGHAPKRQTEIVQECGAGLVTIRRDQGRLSFGAPPLIRSGTPSKDELTEALHFLGIEPCEVVDAAWIDNGPGWLGIRLASAEKVLSLNPERRWPRRIDIGVVGPHAHGDVAFEVRAFFSDHLGTIVEDPVTGSLNASLAQWLFAAGVVEEAYVAAQGTRLGRKGRIHVTRDEARQIWVGGETRTHVEGRLQGLLER
ncbi:MULTISPECIES: PhzF family phenazine biosynthesis protein [unclassified Ensifer]|uniref:PhzF family phenazine biosynthesis protein n=1 Tax=unclassified Ensifer TaxID=2633371 RepID=UPI000812E863|nr:MULTISPECIES: PhzF family phenazine biosynthesis protein [unclassified Ensifer]OCO98393.1 phenazine biosynthesis protein PhzF [Ensifer sp. LC14]OCP02508.1 phenazine biosynthesis protein PhzF [Ensifer sp. LC11]OCP02613.1 phenazine biosynthesis protein PhzF [Ensifer sp. LC13]OCP29836.1 phenazine biosynthesis protein PhzF [Ensifer sp. LC499]